MRTLDGLSSTDTGGQGRIPIAVSSSFFCLKCTDRKKAKERKQTHALMLERKCTTLGGVRSQPAMSCMSFLQEHSTLFLLLTASPVDMEW